MFSKSMFGRDGSRHLGELSSMVKSVNGLFSRGFM